MPKLCECGCGRPTSIAKQKIARLGVEKGQPMRFLQGHSSRFTRNSYKEQRYVVEDCGYTTPCWVWQLHLTPTGHSKDGYGTAFRGSYERAYGPLRPDLVLHHKCENPACINPDHLEPLTRAQHVRRHAKLTEDDVRAIRASTELQKDLALRYGVSAPYISSIRARRVWTDVA